EIAAKLSKAAPEFIKKSEVAGSGFINIFLKDEVMLVSLKEALTRPLAWGKSTEGNGRTVIVEYFQLNIAKEPHVGHLRSAVIGDSLKRILHALGYHVISDTHVGDWGTQFGILLYAYKEAIRHNEAVREKIKSNPFTELQSLYVSANAEEGIREKGKAEFAKLEQGDKENREIWQWMVDISMQKLGESATRLKLLAFEEHRGESMYEEMMPPIVEHALATGVAKKIEDGAVVVDLTHEGLDEAVLVKSDGATTYLLRDLATIKYRKEKWKFWKNLYVVDNRQSHHFRQVFRVAELLGFEGTRDSEHVELGFMKLPEGAMSTRAGNVISLEAVLDEAEQRAYKVIKEKNPDLRDAEQVAKKVGLGAIKYFDLSHDRTSDIVFRWEDVLSFEGNTGPYIQYTYARFRSILRKAGEFTPVFSDHMDLDSDSRGLLFHCLRLPEAMERVRDTWSPHLLAGFLFDLAQKANEFYHARPILSQKDEQKKLFLLMLVQMVILTLANGLYLLGIDAPEEM
ncbi:MAG: arginine--tRNA ligase, partial [Candidatus Sungbacteria bacterium]|nr:arginine--tRNA ligase [Candidatus Sungbacteria bacterium]